MVAPVFRTDPVVPDLCSPKLLPATKVLHMVENASKAHRSSSATSAVFWLNLGAVRWAILAILGLEVGHKYDTMTIHILGQPYLKQNQQDENKLQ